MIRRSSFTKSFCFYGFLLLCATFITNLQAEEAEEAEVLNADADSSNFTEPTDPPSKTTFDVSTEITTRDPFLQHIVKIVVAYSNTFNRTAFETEFRLWWVSYCAQSTKCRVTPTTIAISTSTEHLTSESTTHSTPESITEATTTQSTPESITEATTTQSTPESITEATTTQSTPESVTEATTTQSTPEAITEATTTQSTPMSATSPSTPAKVRKRRAIEDGAATPSVIVIPVQVTIRNIETTNEGKTAIVEFYVATKDGPVLGKAVVENIVQEKETEIAKAVGADKVTIDVQPSPSPDPGPDGSLGWKIAVIVIAIILLVALLIGLIIALRRKRQADAMYNLTTRTPGDGSQYLGQRPLTQTFDNAAYNKSSETVRIGSFDKP